MSFAVCALPKSGLSTSHTSASCGVRFGLGTAMAAGIRSSCPILRGRGGGGTDAGLPAKNILLTY
jgi:hypothetical protein